MTTRWLSPGERMAWVRLVSLVELLPHTFDTQLRRDSDLLYFEYYVLAMLSESEDRTLRMSRLASLTNSTLPRLSHAVGRLEKRGLVTRAPSPEDRRATNASLTEQGWEAVVAAAPAHVEHVRKQVFDVLTPEQVAQLTEISDALLKSLDGTLPVPEHD